MNREYEQRITDQDLMSAEDHGYGLGFKHGREEMRNEMQDEIAALRAEIDRLKDSIDA